MTVINIPDHRMTVMNIPDHIQLGRQSHQDFPLHCLPHHWTNQIHHLMIPHFLHPNLQNMTTILFISFSCISTFYSVSLFISFSVCLYVSKSISLSFSLFVSLSVCLSVYFFQPLVCLSYSVFLSLSVCLSVSLLTFFRLSLFLCSFDLLLEDFSKELSKLVVFSQ